MTISYLLHHTKSEDHCLFFLLSLYNKKQHQAIQQRANQYISRKTHNTISSISYILILDRYSNQQFYFIKKT
uniref:Uncharacterized protein n=1 Tax=Picea glauca TaxID=3330 RepID=A0A101LZK6_PICGL|nr:hypothetical protein ABT39_MTgene5231 [Picea glauca]QHR89162.1 hypothetical protein Q903MT_gene3182 [Picea sitchensis]